MRYESISDLPETLRDVLPERAQEIYLEAYQTQMYPKLYPFSISRYIDIASALCYTDSG
jgi:cation transport regulator ChaB